MLLLWLEMTDDWSGRIKETGPSKKTPTRRQEKQDCGVAIPISPFLS